MVLCLSLFHSFYLFIYFFFNICQLSFFLEIISLFRIVSISSCLWLLALAFLLALLELPEPARPCVPPLDNQATFICHYSTLARGVLIISQQQVLLPRLDLWTLAGHVFGTDPQKLVPTADAALSLLVDGDDVDSKFPPLTGFVRFQDVHLDSCKEKLGSKRRDTWFPFTGFNKHAKVCDW